MFGKFHSEETILKMSEIKKGKARSAESKLKIGLTNSKKLYIFVKKKMILFLIVGKYSLSLSIITLMRLTI